MAHANQLQHRGGLDFFALARGGERSYSTSFLVNLDPDLLSLCANDQYSTYQLSLQALVGHTQRIFKMITAKSKREINQVNAMDFIDCIILLSLGSAVQISTKMDRKC